MVNGVTVVIAANEANLYRAHTATPLLMLRLRGRLAAQARNQSLALGVFYPCAGAGY